MYKFYPFEKVDFWLTVIMHMRSFGKLDHTLTMYLWFSISLHIKKTDSGVEMRVNLSAYSARTSAVKYSYFSVVLKLFLLIS